MSQQPTPPPEKFAIESFFSADEEQEIVNAIRIAENNTSGEIRVHLEKKVKTDVYQHAKKIFATLKMHKTQNRNAVLFLVAIENRSFAIYGDKGIHAHVGDAFWQNIKKILETHFQKKEFKKGLVQAILESGEQLKEYFPYQKNDVNELLDEISKGE